MSYRAATASRPADRGDVNPATVHETVRYAAALFLMAALIHLWTAPEHLGEWWGYGAFFPAASLGQGLYAASLLLLHGLGRSRSLFLLGAVGNLALVALYVVTRTVGIPLLGPHAGEVEGISPLGLAATASELALVVALGALALERDVLGGRRGTAALGLALVVLALSAYGVSHDSHAASPPDNHADHHAAALEPKPSVRLEAPEGRFARYHEDMLSGGG